MSRLATGTEERRRRLKAECRFVDRGEFCRLLVSTRGLERWDDRGARVRGLLDRDTGERYAIESELLDGALLEGAA